MRIGGLLNGPVLMATGCSRDHLIVSICLRTNSFFLSWPKPPKSGSQRLDNTPSILRDSSWFNGCNAMARDVKTTSGFTHSGYIPRSVLRQPHRLRWSENDRGQATCFLGQHPVAFIDCRQPDETSCYHANECTRTANVVVGASQRQYSQHRTNVIVWAETLLLSS